MSLFEKFSVSCSTATGRENRHVSPATRLGAGLFVCLCRNPRQPVRSIRSSRLGAGLPHIAHFTGVWSGGWRYVWRVGGWCYLGSILLLGGFFIEASVRGMPCSRLPSAVLAKRAAQACTTMREEGNTKVYYSLGLCLSCASGEAGPQPQVRRRIGRMSKAESLFWAPFGRCPRTRLLSLDLWGNGDGGVLHDNLHACVPVGER
jgi:hypothetical protein